MGIKYQVFVSSTYKDLIKERQEVMHSLLNLECIPSGMELFPATNDAQWELIKEVIDECDYYVLILAGRYGSIDESTGISYTEMEYNYAIDQKKQVLAFLHEDPKKISAGFTEDSVKGKKQLKAFRNLASSSKMCQFWNDASELSLKVTQSLVSEIKRHPGIGWVRGDKVPKQEANLEILDLKKKIDSLKEEIEINKITEPKGAEDLAKGDETYLLKYNVTGMADLYKSYTWIISIDVSWNAIFYQLSPLMIDESSDKILKSTMNVEFMTEVYNKWINTTTKAERKNDRKEEIKFSNAFLNASDFNTIKVQLRALGLMQKSIKKRGVRDTATYWSLTPYGENVMNILRAIKSKED